MHMKVVSCLHIVNITLISLLDRKSPSLCWFHSHYVRFISVGIIFFLTARHGAHLRQYNTWASWSVCPAGLHQCGWNAALLWHRYFRLWGHQSGKWAVGADLPLWCLVSADLPFWCLVSADLSSVQSVLIFQWWLIGRLTNWLCAWWIDWLME